MDGCKVFLIYLIVLSYVVTFGSSTKEANTCHPDVPCDDGSCTSRRNWCDNFSDCFDTSDEKYCGNGKSSDAVCNEALHFECANTKCVPVVLVCDGFDDCKDNSDEANCATLQPDAVETKPAERRTTEEPNPYPDIAISSKLHTIPSYDRQTHTRPAISVTSSTSSLYGRQLPDIQPNKRTPLQWPLPLFHFQEDRSQTSARRYSRAVDRAEQWLLGRSDAWGEDGPRALVALSLSGNRFRPSETDYDIARRKLKLDLGARLLRNARNPMSDHLLATYINALVATCQDPRKVYKRDLVSLLYNNTHDPRRRTVPTPYVLLTLCLADSSISNEDFRFLEDIVNSRIHYEVSKDRFILSTSALACIQKRGLYENELRGVLRTASHKLLGEQFDDGSFGSIYSTALAAQAFFALDSDVWNPDKTLDFLVGQQLDDGSFGDMLATSYILPILSGRSLVHLRTTQCEKPEDETPSEELGPGFSGRKKTVWYSLAMGLERKNPLTWEITVPADANFFQIMQEAQKLHPRFRFLYTEFLGKIDVYTISGVPNDPERGTYWQLHVQTKKGHTVAASHAYYGDIRNLVPEDQQELLYWYSPYKASFY